MSKLLGISLINDLINELPALRDVRSDLSVKGGCRVRSTPLMLLDALELSRTASAHFAVPESSGRSSRSPAKRTEPLGAALWRRLHLVVAAEIASMAYG